MATSVPFLDAPNDTMRAGIQSFRGGLLPKHPVDQMQQNFQKSKYEAQMSNLKNTLGSHAAMRFAMECQILSNFQRLPSLDSCHVGLDCLLGDDDVMGFEDILNDPRDSMSCPPPLHETMEKRLGLVDMSFDAINRPHGTEMRGFF